MPSRASSRSLTAVPVHRGHDAWDGNETLPQASQLLPMSRGASLGHVKSPSAIGRISIFLIIYQPDRAADDISRHPAFGSTVDSSVQPISMYLSAIFHVPSTLRTVS